MRVAPGSLRMGDNARKARGDRREMSEGLVHKRHMVQQVVMRLDGSIPVTAAAFFALLAPVVVVALVCNGERADRAVTVLRALLRSRVPRE